VEEDPHYILAQNDNDAENIEVEDVGAKGGEIEGTLATTNVGAEGGEIEGTRITTKTMSALLFFSTQNSTKFFPSEDGYFYDRENIRYVQTENEPLYTYHWNVSILLDTTTSPTFSKKVSSPITSAMVDRAMEYTSPPLLTPIGEPSLNEEMETGGEGEAEDLIRVLETLDATMD